METFGERLKKSRKDKSLLQTQLANLLGMEKHKEFKELFGPLLTSADDISQRETDFPLSEQPTDNQAGKEIEFNSFAHICNYLGESRWELIIIKTDNIAVFKRRQTLPKE
jgi:transcriptional regulator with XRE-family HTH domain